MPAPLEGLRVLDLGWLMVGPISARYLTDLGADTIKLESGRRKDPLRSMAPFKDGKRGPERSVVYHMINAGKRSLAMDIRGAAGKQIVHKLVKWADVLIESFSPGMIDRMGYSYRELSAINPRLIMVSTGILGRTGPYGLGTSGTGITGSAFSGATALLGWPDRKPTGPSGPWTDSVAPRFVVSSILAALHRRKTTGTGCYIDVAQAECGLQFLLPAFADGAAHGRSQERQGHAGSALRCPSGVFPCKGADRWIAIDASDNASWLALKEVVGAPLSDPNFDTLVGRLRHRQDIEAAISKWTQSHEPHQLETRLQAQQVPAHVVCSATDLAEDPDLRHHHHYNTVVDPVIGEFTVTGPQFRLTVTPHMPPRPGPCIGDAADDILTSICGLSDGDIAKLKTDGILG
ncbi:MAG: CoA transferase [Acetobacteraceae bacterium]|nr:CoA transferase [Acetobacteraceae bacterium]